MDNAEVYLVLAFSFSFLFYIIFSTAYFSPCHVQNIKYYVPRVFP